MSFGATPLSTTTLGANQFPVSAAAVPGHSGGDLTALEGGTESTDSNGNKTAPAILQRRTYALFSQASGAITATGNSGDLDISKITTVGIDINITTQSGTTPTIQFFWTRKGADGLYYPLWQTKVALGTDTLPEKFSASIGPGMAYNQLIGLTGQLSWVVTGTTPSFTCSLNVYGE